MLLFVITLNQETYLPKQVCS